MRGGCAETIDIACADGMEEEEEEKEEEERGSQSASDLIANCFLRDPHVRKTGAH